MAILAGSGGRGRQGEGRGRQNSLLPQQPCCCLLPPCLPPHTTPSSYTILSPALLSSSSTSLTLLFCPLHTPPPPALLQTDQTIRLKSSMHVYYTPLVIEMERELSLSASSMEETILGGGWCSYAWVVLVVVVGMAGTTGWHFAGELGQWVSEL